MKIKQQPDQPAITRDGVIIIPRGTLQPGDVITITASDHLDGMTWKIDVKPGDEEQSKKTLPGDETSGL